MNLSHRLTFSLVFSILFVAGFALVPTVMAAEGGPAIVSIVLDDSMTLGHTGNATSDPVIEAVSATATVSNGNALLTAPDPGATTAVAGNRVILLDVGAAMDTTSGVGFFRLLVTFGEDVYNADTAKPDAPHDPDTSLHDQSATRTGLVEADDLKSSDFRILSAIGLIDGQNVTGLTVSNVTRVQTAGANTDAADDDKYSLRQFYVEITVPNAALESLPMNVAIVVNADAGIFGIGTNRQISPFVAAQNGLSNEGYVADVKPGAPQQPYTQYDFQVIPRAISAVTITGRPSGAIRSHQRIILTLTFDPALNVSDVPTRTNILVTNGEILDDDTSTADVDEGINDISPTNVPHTRYVLTILPQGGGGDTYTITVRNAVGTAFVLNEAYQVNNLPEAQRVTITGPQTVPADGIPFVVNIVYSVAPATPLTDAGVTVENGTKVAGSFSGPGGVSRRNYSVRIDPNNPTSNNPVTVTVRVGQDFATFTTSVAGTTPTPTPTPDDPHAPIEITLAAGLEAGKYLVVTPATITRTVGSEMNADVLPAVGVTYETQATMPDLENLLFGGGTIDVYVDAGTGNTAADININEIMWALDEGEVGTVGHTAHQWIELHNNSTENAAAGTITLWFKPRTLTSAPTDEGTRTDRLSNNQKYDLLQTGWRIAGKGQNGNSQSDPKIDFISMVRTGANGIHPNSWAKSTRSTYVNHIATPGEANTRTGVNPTVDFRPGLNANGSLNRGVIDGKIRYHPPKNSVIINEVHNNSDDDLDWLELRFLKRTNIQRWTLSWAARDFQERKIIKFPNRALWFDAETILLIVNKDPKETPLAAGQNVKVGGVDNQARGAGPHKYWVLPSEGGHADYYLDIPNSGNNYNDGDFLLILRTADGDHRFGSRDRMHDVIGTGTFEKKTLRVANRSDIQREPHTRFASSAGGDNQGYIWFTRTWPINGHDNIANYHPANAGSLLQNDRKLAVGSVLARNGTTHGWKKDGIYFPGRKGELGYDRGVVGYGTPGYKNDVVKAKHTDLANGKVVVSELMLTTDSGRYPQWIELHNTSKDNTVDLHADTDGGGARQGWSIRVENNRSDSWDTRRKDRLHVEVKFRNLGVRFIPPNQTILIVGDKVLNSGTDRSVHFPDHRVGSIWTASGNPFKMETRRDIFLNPKGFRLEIVDGSGQVSDVVGNMDGRRPDVFNPRLDENDDVINFDSPLDNGSWNWPTEESMVINNRRTSLIRLRDDGVVRAGVPTSTTDMTGAVLPLGTKWRGAGKTGEEGEAKHFAKYAKHTWVHAVDTKLARRQITWYGSSLDIGTPGHTTSTPLPVQLSSFRPALEDGEIVIRWTTESELDNAGFNIYRSETRNGEYKQVNAELIAGNGTTGERNTYKWVDTTAKPGAVYYYQIEDVSFAGERQALAITKLRGLISAENKLTTRWGEIKEVQ